MAASRIWKLRRRDDVIAELVVTGEDFPWLHATVRPGAGFEALRPLFDDEVRLSEDDDDADAWEAAYDRIRQAVGLIAPDGRAVPEFLLHIDGEDAWWRWSDEPFPRGPVVSPARSSANFGAWSSSRKTSPNPSCA